ncbi:class I SAM-dependent methyltransferase [Streptomyces sp. HUAS TT20]|uniref:class I SAM-dependent methyltransferase n=1 Tax=Streptomyces sp. HUAS TT20 TaxID=3447509 RepID=UPI0021D9E192|nr:methyltransferase domain-containing protein [Streptomyces sp. HUAS 15-9]UXY28466.1 methyltransferase domain-containing protein [Streptomyces sp. HUAS 15-9]
MADEPGFQLKGSAPERYEEYVAPLMAPFTTALLDAVDLCPGDVVLDLACGTGFAARAAAAQVGPAGRVRGVDVNADMLKVAVAHHPRLYPDIEFTEASADRLPYPDATFDAVVCQQGAQFFPDLTAALTETARVMRPSGRFAATVWADMSLSPYLTAQYEAIKEYGGDEAAADFSTAFACTADRLTDALGKAGCHDVTTREIAFGIALPPLTDFAPGHLSVLPWGQRLADAHGEETLAAAGHSVAARLADRTGPDGRLTLPFTAILATAIR